MFGITAHLARCSIQYYFPPDHRRRIFQGSCTVPIIREEPTLFFVFALAMISVHLGFANIILSIIVVYVSAPFRKLPFGAGLLQTGIWSTPSLAFHALCHANVLLLMIIILLAMWSIVAVELVHPVSLRLDQTNDWCDSAFSSVQQSMLLFFYTIVARPWFLCILASTLFWDFSWG